MIKTDSKHFLKIFLRQKSPEYPGFSETIMWQASEDSNPDPTALEAGVLPLVRLTYKPATIDVMSFLTGPVSKLGES